MMLLFISQIRTASKVITGKQLTSFSDSFWSVKADGTTPNGAAVIEDNIATIVYLNNEGTESPIAGGAELYGVITSAVAVGEDECEFTVWTSNGESVGR